MDNDLDLRKELKALGNELAEAFKQIRSSAELKALEREVVKGIKNVSATLAHSLKVAAQSEQTAKIGHRLKTVARAGAKEGAHGAGVARKALVARFKRLRAAAQARRHRNNTHAAA